MILPSIDLANIRASAKQRWLSERKARSTFLDRVENSVPWWLIVIALTIFALSASHTIETFNLITPGLAVVAPLFVELGLLYTAFHRKKSRKSGEEVGLINWLFEIMLFMVAVGVNAVGSWNMIVTALGIDNLPFDKIMAGYSQMPSKQAAALLLVPAAAVIIPVGAVAVGEGLSKLIFERKQQTDTTEQDWIVAAPEYLYPVFFDALIAAGETPAKAAGLAERYAGAAPKKQTFSKLVSSEPVTPETAEIVENH